MKRVIAVVQFVVILILPTIYFNLYFSMGTYFNNRMNESVGDFCDFHILRITMGLVSCLFLIVFFILSQYFIKTSLIKRAAVILTLVLHLIFGGVLLNVEFLWYYRSDVVVQMLMVAIVLTVLGKWTRLGTGKTK